MTDQKEFYWNCMVPELTMIDSPVSLYFYAASCHQFLPREVRKIFLPAARNQLLAIQTKGDSPDPQCIRVVKGR